MTFSIIIPVYNVVPYLHACLKSVVAAKKHLQEEVPAASVEIVCVDDGSTDGSGRILDDCASSFGLKVVHQANSGASQARNAGIMAATGEWLGMVDADDLIAEDWLVQAARIIETEAPDMVRMKCAKFGDGVEDRKIPAGDAYEVFEGNEAYVWGWKKFVSQDCGGTVLYFVRRAVIVENGLRLPERMRIYEDRIFSLMLMPWMRKIVQSDYHGYLYRMREGSACHTKRLCSDTLRYVEELRSLVTSQKSRIESSGLCRELAEAITSTLDYDIAELSEIGILRDWLPSRDVPEKLRELDEIGLIDSRFVRRRWRLPFIVALRYGTMYGYLMVIGALRCYRALGLTKLKETIRKRLA